MYKGNATVKYSRTPCSCISVASIREYAVASHTFAFAVVYIILTNAFRDFIFKSCMAYNSLKLKCFVFCINAHRIPYIFEVVKDFIVTTTHSYKNSDIW